jgi:hypothetical protein
VSEQDEFQRLSKLYEECALDELRAFYGVKLEAPGESKTVVEQRLREFCMTSGRNLSDLDDVFRRVQSRIAENIPM